MKTLSKSWASLNIQFDRTSSNGNTNVLSSYRYDSWYDNLLKLADERQNQLDTYDKMDMSMDISRALDIIAEDLSSTNADDDEIVFIDFPDSIELKDSEIKAHRMILQKWQQNTSISRKFFNWSREAIKYGMTILVKKSNGNLKKIDSRSIIGFKLKDDSDIESITHYLIKYPNKKEIIEMPIEDLIVLKIGDGPFGRSVLEKVHRVWKQFQLLEDAMIIYRIVRAPERRVFYISIGDQQRKKAQAYLNEIKRDLTQKRISKNSSGDVDTVYNPTNIQEDYFITQDSEGRGSRVETLPGGQNLGQMEELEFFNKRIALALRIPPSYLDTFSQSNDGSQYNDGRLGTAYIVELRYAGYIKRLQIEFEYELQKHFEDFAKKNGVILNENLNIKIAPPQSFGIYKEIELNSAKLNTYSSAEQIESLSKRYILMKYLGMNQDELLDNEKKKIEEMGLDYSKLSEMEINNLVYGDKSLMPINNENNDVMDNGGNDEQNFN